MARQLASPPVGCLLGPMSGCLLDRVLGTVFGFARGVILILVLVFVLRQLIPPQDLQWLEASRLMPHLDMLADWARTLFAGIGSAGTTT